MLRSNNHPGQAAPDPQSGRLITIDAQNLSCVEYCEMRFPDMKSGVIQKAKKLNFIFKNGDMTVLLLKPLNERVGDYLIDYKKTRIYNYLDHDKQWKCFSEIQSGQR